jgi:hypothetical protein
MFIFAMTRFVGNHGFKGILVVGNIANMLIRSVSFSAYYFLNV